LSEETGRILVVDDEPLMRGLLLKALKEKGHHIDTCEDGKSALGKLGQNSYDIVITDHSMPRMTGVELIQSFRSGGGRTPFILMTSYALEELANPGEAFDGVEFLRKPFGLTELHKAIRKAIYPTKR
jgi:CheY-like chemotaxis protein